MTDSLPFHMLQIMKSLLLKPVKGTPFVRSPPRCSAKRNNLVQQETRDRMVDILLSFILQITARYMSITYRISSKNSRPELIASLE